MSDFMNSIAAQSMSMAAAQFQNDYALSMQKKIMDTQELALEELLDMLPDIPQMPKGQYIDTYA